jgi:F-type H+-transporting ATPase subunit epsilon
MADVELRIITPERIVFEGKADMVILPGAAGELGVLPRHTPLLSLLRIGELRAKRAGEVDHFALSEGFVEVCDNRVTVMVDAAEHAREIDLERAKRAKERAEKALEQRTKMTELDFAQSQGALERALTRIRVARWRES